VGGYNTVLSDGERHAGARAGSPLLIQHDLHSAAWMLRQFEPQDASLVEAYYTAVAFLDRSALTCSAALKLIGEYVEVVGINPILSAALTPENSCGPT
jgi:hypothetical protein